MFFYLSKILAFILTPLVWIIVILIAALSFKNIKKQRRLLIASLVILFIFSNSFIADEIMRLWEIPAKKDAEISSVYDVGIVLGGVSYFDEDYSRIQFARSADRLFQAIDLYKKGKIKKILFTGGSGSISLPHLKEAAIVNDYLLTFGIPKEDIILENESKNTRENAVFTKKILDKQNKPGKYLLITSAFHMRRSIGCFKKAGIEATPYSTDRYSGPRKFIFDHLFIPNADAVAIWTLLIHEITGFCVYKVLGYA